MGLYPEVRALLVCKNYSREKVTEIDKHKKPIPVQLNYCRKKFYMTDLGFN